ncbi:MAG: response regulator transcription factor [Candidatus Heimdallarchaeota archaeon]|nr:response regulator transcription factor [Candidatus Heimdallarchaeota archaeon]
MQSYEATKIFVIDDSVFIRNAFMDLLTVLDFEIVGIASTGKDAFKYVAETRPDLVLLDTSIPNFTAHEMIRGLLAINRNLDIIILAPLSNQNEIASLLREGAVDYIPKPIIARQVEYVLRGYELSSGVKPPTEIQTIAQIYSIYFEEILKIAPESLAKIIEKAALDPLKRLSKKYNDRYTIELNPIRIHLNMAQETHSRKIYLMYKNQLSRLFISIVNRLSKQLPEEYIFSLMSEAYQSYYPLARYLLVDIDFSLPVWKNYNVETNKEAIMNKRINARFDYVYLKNEDSMLPQIETSVDPSSKLQAYKQVVRHDPRVAPRFPRPTDTDLSALDIHVLLSYFDEIVGPKTELIIPPPHGRIEKDKLQSIPRFLDLMGVNPGEPFIHSVNDYGSINMVFTVDSHDARGGSKDFMISIAVSPAEITVMIKISQLGALLRAVTAEIANHYRFKGEREDSMKLISTPQEILETLLYELTKYLKSS